VADGWVAPLRTIKELNVVEHAVSSLVARAVDLPRGALDLQRREEVSTAASSQTFPDLLMMHETPFSAINFWNCTLIYWPPLPTALVRMMKQRIRLYAAPDRHKRCLPAPLLMGPRLGLVSFVQAHQPGRSAWPSAAPAAALQLAQPAPHGSYRLRRSLGRAQAGR
jgi:hypothetical protein